MSNHATITGNLGSDPELRFIPSGKAVCTVSVGDTPRKFNRDTNAWEDAGETLWLRCTIWGDVAESVASELRKGDRVTVIGKLKARSWDDKDGTKRREVEVDADTIAKVVKPAPAARTQAPQQADDPWAAPPAQGGWGSQPPKGGAGWGAPAADEPPF